MGLSPYGHPQAPIADATALAAIVAAERFDGKIERLADGTLWQFDEDSATAAVAGQVVAPDAGDGRWHRMLTSMSAASGAVAGAADAAAIRTAAGATVTGSALITAASAAAAATACGATVTGAALLTAATAAAARGTLGIDAANGVGSVTLAAAGEAGNAIVVTGQVKDAAGANVAVATNVLVTTLSTTDAKGAITVTVGTEKVNETGAGNHSMCWLETNATGGFAVSIANDQAEVTLVSVIADGCTAKNLALNFALV